MSGCVLLLGFARHMTDCHPSWNLTLPLLPTAAGAGPVAPGTAHAAGLPANPVSTRHTCSASTRARTPGARLCTNSSGLGPTTMPASCFWQQGSDKRQPSSTENKCVLKAGLGVARATWQQWLGDSCDSLIRSAFPTKSDRLMRCLAAAKRPHTHALLHKYVLPSAARRWCTHRQVFCHAAVAADQCPLGRAAVDCSTR